MRLIARRVKAVAHRSQPKRVPASSFICQGAWIKIIAHASGLMPSAYSLYLARSTPYLRAVASMPYLSIVFIVFVASFIRTHPFSSGE